MDTIILPVPPADLLSLLGASSLTAIVETLPVAIFYIDGQGQCRYANPQLCSLTGLGFDELQQSGWLSAVHPEDADRVRQEWAAAQATGQWFQSEYRFLRPDRSVRWIYAQAQVHHHDGTGGASGPHYVGTCTDITNRKQTEIELRRYQQALESASDAIAITDAQGHILYTNAAWLALYPHPAPEEPQPHSLATYLSDSLALQGIFTAVMAGQTWQHELILNDRQGRLVPVFLRVSPIVTPSQQITGLICIATDISEHKRIEQETQAKAQALETAIHELQSTQTQLIQTEKMSSLGQLVAGVAHEINNPVNFIYGNLSHARDYIHDLLDLINCYQREYPEPTAAVRARQASIDLDFVQADIQQLFRSMQVGADRIKEIVTSLRIFSRMDEAEMKAVNLHEGIESTLLILHNRLKPKPGSSGIEVVRHYDPHLPLVECYAGQLNQVFMNLLNNAIDALVATPEQPTPTLEIITRCLPERWVQIAFSDNGPGIPPEQQPRLFDPFFTTKAVGEGTGLGLSISYQVVTERHGGRLTCDSVVGQGTTFTVTIPIDQTS